MVIKDIKGCVIFKSANRTIKDAIEEAIKKGVNLRYADLWRANLSGASLIGADLSCVDLIGANLRNADLRNANLSDADLSGANLSGAILRYAKNVPNIPMSCPENGEFIGWKKIFVSKEFHVTRFIVKLLIPEDAKRCSATTNKCRCDKAKVLEIKNIATGKAVDIITNKNRTNCVYKVGEMVYPDSFDEDRWNECSHGIHFFVNKEDALNYCY